ncbi:hypothetical protein [Telmatospirillum sp.]|uniref:hypothetical protein n=1 Tax=Telmatospirillum sp. TaxID=2079197 RepID=UPI0028521D58|nr:hypothetical protein [Telmatospirillum sp.]MDR3436973.1 hypothetical protein [Telmatospirillum sp.]
MSSVRPIDGGTYAIMGLPFSLEVMMRLSILPLATIGFFLAACTEMPAAPGAASSPSPPESVVTGSRIPQDPTTGNLSVVYPGDNNQPTPSSAAMLRRSLWPVVQGR